MSIDKYDQALKQALDGMNVPMDLHGIVSAYLQAVGEVIAREEIPDLILSAERNAPGRTKFHLRLSEWDAEKDAAWTDGTAARTPERRAVVMKRLGVSDDVASRINEAFPVFVDRTKPSSPRRGHPGTTRSGGGRTTSTGTATGHCWRRDCRLKQWRASTRPPPTSSDDSPTLRGRALPVEGAGRRSRSERQDRQLHRCHRQGHRRGLPAHHRAYRNRRDPALPDPAPTRHGAHRKGEHPRGNQ